MPAHMTGLVPRHLEAVIADRLTEEAVVVLNGARSVGKSTLLRRCAEARNVRILDLDDVRTREAVEIDPTYFIVGQPEPVCIDEFQHVLTLLDAIKARLNREMHPGMYLLTGSTRYTTLPATSQSLTGRAHIVDVWPLSQGELRGRKETFLSMLVSDPAQLITPTPSTTTRAEYERIVLTGGFPIALTRTSESARRRWFRDFVHMVVSRDVLDIRKVRQRDVLPDILRHLVAQTGQILNVTSVSNNVSLDRTTVGDFISLLESVFLIHRLYAYGRTLSARVNRSPKVHIVDSGLGASLLGITEAKLAERDLAALTEFGHLLETFAVNEVLKQATWCDIPLTFSHLRTRDDEEVDLIGETDDGHVVGIEIKAAGSVQGDDFKGLRFLREKLGDAFVGGIVLHLGERSYRREDRLYVAPLDCLWK